MDQTKRYFFEHRIQVRLKRSRLGLRIFIGLIGGVRIFAAAPEQGAALLTKENVVDVARSGASWQAGVPGQPLAIQDQVRTGELSRGTVRLTNLSVLRMDELTTIQILPPEQLGRSEGMNLRGGAVYFFSRERPENLRIQTPVATGALRGTEFHLRVAEDGRTTLTMLDGEVELRNAFGSVALHSGEQGEVVRGQAPRKTAVIETINIIQWCLYYPGVIDVDELKLPEEVGHKLASSVEAYRQGDVLGALRAYPMNRSAKSGPEQIYRAALFLTVGQVDKAEAALRQTTVRNSQRRALETLIAAVKYQPKQSAQGVASAQSSVANSAQPQTASEWLAQSYYEQAQAKLESALAAAKRAVELSPSLGFAWTRVAELEFSFGRTRNAARALEQGTLLAPKNAAAFALRGFVLSAQNRIGQAKESFEEAMILDGALGDAWLGHGLCLIRQGHNLEGRADIQTAATLEPNRALFRSYLGKAFSNAGEDREAELELKRSIEIDPNDPTPWLYSALQARQEHRLNAAVRDLEQSVELNDNRRLFRSEFLLDQDRAVRSTNLASIYQDDGMTELSVREATKAVEYDYADASAHRFLADSYNALRDPRRITLRFETPWQNELLLYNLISPVGGGSLSAFVSQQEYSKLFESNRLALTSTIDYLSNGELHEVGSQYGIYDNISYDFDNEYLYQRSLNRPNSQTDNFEAVGRAKVQLSPQDTAYFEVQTVSLRTGDVAQHFDPNAFAPIHYHEMQDPGVLLFGYHHDWNPGIQTICLFARLNDSNDLKNPEFPSLLVLGEGARVGSQTFRPGEVTFASLSTSLPLQQHYQSSFEIYDGEINQIFETTFNTLILGARFQQGSFDTTSNFNPAQNFPASVVLDSSVHQHVQVNFDRATGYVYDIVRPIKQLSLTFGLTYDSIEYPQNFRDAPILGTQSSIDRFSPKVGVTWNPMGQLVVRGAYTKALGGASFDESFLLEPTQVAGFTQVYRSIIPESIAGPVSAPRFENYGVSLEDRFSTGTYVGIKGTLQKSSVDRQIGTFQGQGEPPPPPPSPIPIDSPVFASSTPERLRYDEQQLLITVNQLVGEEFSFGGVYRLTAARLEDIFPLLPASVYSRSRVENFEALNPNRRATLQQLNLFALFNHPSGFFASADALWSHQENNQSSLIQVQQFDKNTGALANGVGNDNFWQLNARIGYRFHRNLAEISIGFLNITDQNYTLNPLNLYEELPRERTVLVRAKLNF
jgi:tetratricopeptide (TPR) repeat protein